MPSDREEGAERLEKGRKRLFSLVGQLADAYSRQAGRPYLTRKLKTIIDATTQQFAAEESFLARIGDPHFAQHRASHVEIVRHLLDMAADYRIDSRDFIVAELAEFFWDWLLLHGVNHDAHYLVPTGLGAPWARCA